MKALLLLPLLTAAWAQDRPDREEASGWWESGKAALEARLALESKTGRAKNVILFIGDGMGVSTVTAARILDGQNRGMAGEENRLSFEELPYSALIKTYNVNAQVPDSAGTATAMLTGIKTNIGVLNVAPEQTPGRCKGSIEHRLMSFAGAMERRGKATGIVSTARLTHATPASVYAQSPSRNWEDDSALPEEARANGCSDIAAQLIDFAAGDGIDVALGGGWRHFVPQGAGFLGDASQPGRRTDGRDLTAEWTARSTDAVYVDTADALAGRDPAATGPVLGLFSPSHMAFEADREEAAGSEPSLKAMTEAAIDLLAHHGDGFFLMVEGARIDHAHHAGNAYRSLTDAVAFADAVAAALDKVDLDETLILVTADHSHVFTMAGYPPRGNPILGVVKEIAEDGSAGGEPRLAADGKPYTTLGYGNGPGAVEGERPAVDDAAAMASDFRQPAAIPLRSETHGGEDVALYAAGPWAHLVGGVLEQHVIYHLMDHAVRGGADEKRD